jgi:hypothetical protein
MERKYMTNQAKKFDQESHDNNDFGGTQEVPTVTTLLKRKKLGTNTLNTIEAPPVPSQTIELDIQNQSKVTEITKSLKYQITEQQTRTNPKVRKPGEPPQFVKNLIFEKQDLNSLKKNLKNYSKSSDLKKLFYLGFFANYFNEVAYYQYDISNSFRGRFGYGNLQLIALTQNNFINSFNADHILQIINNGVPYIGPGLALPEKCIESLQKLSFHKNHFIGIFPVLQKKKVVGVWLCTSNQDVTLSQKDLKNLTKLMEKF